MAEKATIERQKNLKINSSDIRQSRKRASWGVTCEIYAPVCGGRKEKRPVATGSGSVDGDGGMVHWRLGPLEELVILLVVYIIVCLWCHKIKYKTYMLLFYINMHNTNIEIFYLSICLCFCIYVSSAPPPPTKKK